MSRAATLICLLLGLGGTPAHALQAAARQGDQQRLDSLLLDQATGLLERYGDTFYLLNYAIDRDGTLEGIAPDRWPALDAPPDDWVDTIQMAYRPHIPRLRAAAYLVDRWRQLDPTRADSTFAIFHYETAGGLCVETRRHYEWTSEGPVAWASPEPLSCRRRLWLDAAEAPH